ncbi:MULTISPECIES: LysR family transcriptional regulator [unclassified Janthinobacterium]|uniref:LysR family transcriptional regulator n=1 Tax=unclassified Janthinobacterium TaxID=2610881 RepID=UPI000C7130CF|nr:MULTISPECIES: LysR family transcriptional regulator [unclassified Janthinobacterium]PKV47774.1 DNA-binding transcriptional LysR family regulator [Janthinobacterium sp. 61]TDY30107.1 DNA-binding transcriptional LysR family regulator [Janthinobacterium sp. 75]
MFSSEHLKGLTPFLATADAGSFTKAAERLHLSSSAVSKSVARLEERLGVLLFERSTRRLKLSDAGRAYYATCKRVLQELADAEDVLAEHATELAGKVRIGVPASYGRLRVMPALLELCAQYPRLQPSIAFSDRFVDLFEERIDIAVRIGAPGNWPQTLGQMPLGEERLIFCAAPAYLERRGTPVTIADLDGHDCIAYGRGDGTAAPWLFAGEDGVERRAVRPRLTVGDAEAQTAAVLAGLGIAQQATWLVQEHLASGAIVEVLPACATPGLPLSLAWPLARQLTAKTGTLLKELKQRLTIS